MRQVLPDLLVPNFTHQPPLQAQQSTQSVCPPLYTRMYPAGQGAARAGKVDAGSAG
jgi:hypothetical protein